MSVPVTVAIEQLWPDGWRLRVRTVKGSHEWRLSRPDGTRSGFRLAKQGYADTLIQARDAGIREHTRLTQQKGAA